MVFNLQIKPLSNVQSMFYQKCLIQTEIYPNNIQPGSWTQCYFTITDDETTRIKYSSLCQTFPSVEGEQDICYLDLTVSNIVNTTQDYSKYKLIDIQQLSSTSIAVKNVQAINVVVQLIPDFFIENGYLNIDKAHLNTIAQILMQGYYLFNKCCVRNDEFSKCGVDYIQVEVNNDELQASEIFLLDENCSINIKDVRITTLPLNKEKRINLNVPTFNGPRRQLEDFMQLLKMQRKQKPENRPKDEHILIIPLNILIIGRVGCGKTTLIETFLHDNNCNIFRITPSHILKSYPGESEQHIRCVFQAATYFEKILKPKEPVVIVLEDFHILCPDMKRKNNINDFNMQRICHELCVQVDGLYHSGIPIMCIATTSSPEYLDNRMQRGERFDKEIIIKSLAEEERQEIINQLLTVHLPSIGNTSIDLVELMAKLTQGFTLGDINLLICNITREVLRSSQANVELIFRNNLHKLKSISVLAADINICKTTNTFSSIGGMDYLKRILNMSILTGMKKPETFKRLHLSLPKGILLYGPPGCAKTTIAQCLATETNMRLICTSGADIYSPYVGCAEKYLIRIFNTARKNAPCLIFLDEIDSLVGRRSYNSVSDSRGSIQLRILSTLLMEMDGIANSNRVNDHNKDSYILVVAATNRPDLLDNALLRPGRFDKLIHVAVPDFHTRFSIFQLQSERMPFNHNVNLNDLARKTDNYSGADICNLCNEAALEAFQRDALTNDILNEDFDKVLNKTQASLSPQQIDWYGQFERSYKILYNN